MLFYDTIAIGTPKLAINQQPGPSGKSSLQQYTEFMRRMATYYGDNLISSDSSVMRSDDSLREVGLTGIRNRRDPTLCKEYDGDITISYDTAIQVQQLVQSMFQEQLEHASMCSKIFKMLFDIQRDPTSGRVRIALHENILRKGVPEINRINFIAREQLMKYYSNCEVKYLSGIKLVIDSKRREKAAELEEKQKAAIPEAVKSVERFMGTAPKFIPASKESIEAARARGQLPPRPSVPAPPVPAPSAPSAPAAPAATYVTPMKKVFANPSISAPAVPAATAAAPAPAAQYVTPLKKVFANPPISAPAVPAATAASKPPASYVAPIKKVFANPSDSIQRFMTQPIAASKESVAAAKAKAAAAKKP